MPRGGRRKESPWGGPRGRTGRAKRVYEEIVKHPPGTPVETDHIKTERGRDDEKSK